MDLLVGLQIRSILFTYDDYSLYVCDGSGYMFKWELAFQRRLDEYTSSGGYCDVACTKDGMACCTVSNDGTLKEAVQGEVWNPNYFHGKGIVGNNSSIYILISDTVGQNLIKVILQYHTFFIINSSVIIGLIPK